MKAYQAFARDVGSDALAKWSGSGGILLTLAASAFPSLLNGPWPFLGLGAGCFFVACLRAWLVAYRRTLPRFELVPDHPERRVGSTERGHVDEQHRIAVKNLGLAPIEDIHVFLERLADDARLIDLNVVGVDHGEVRLHHDIPRLFELFGYEQGSEYELRLSGRAGQRSFWIEVPTHPFTVCVAVTGKDVQTRRYVLPVTPSAEGLDVGPPQEFLNSCSE